MGGLTTALDCVFVVYFILQVPIIVLFDSQMILPSSLYPTSLQKLFTGYSREFKDPLVLDLPVWYKSIIFCEVTAHLPFVLLGAYAFMKGGCRWIRIPLLLYATHVASLGFVIISHFLLHDFSDNVKHPGPSTMAERLKVVSGYAMYLVVPILMILRMLLDREYCGKEKHA